ncbi:hypothetical protein L1987_25220 [Smallanthus sonchifolius]|uniref:Uncharacterized protein n=1 Tax=Smallanthus sonchifolius TaxID=185202 RepID=A0ACB9IMM7_9ASTR|nr:hypothetical protein L1987_25220 [Smallanthus sonchifolius]
MENERKHPSIFIDLTAYKSDRFSSKMETHKCELITPPTPPLANSSGDQNSERSKKRLRNTVKLGTKMPKFRPKVLVRSPITPSGGGPSCRRVLEFGSDSRIRKKSMVIYTESGDCFTHQVSKMCNEKEEEELWKKEQELFKQRASSFITAVRCVQGNRPFMGWKGSVVDSVVGVFLTQNTADNSSSSAFMSLAAKYPIKFNTEGLQNGSLNKHALDWHAVRSAKKSEISHAIQERGMNKRLAARIQDFLDSVHDDKSGLIDLEWLRNATPEEAKKYLMGVYGLGLKSMECLRLLTLRQCAFPVDTHVSRIAVRLGWVEIEELPDGVLMHELEEYPEMNRVQEYLSERLSYLDVETFCSSPPRENTFVPMTRCRRKGATTPVLSFSSPELQDIEDICLGPQSQALKFVGRSMTKHRVYELHDAHPLVQELDKRDPEDRNPYLLVTWPRGEKIENPSVVVEEEEETVFGTLLVPCRTATRGSFPLDGTYFQINEVFAHDESSEKPLVVPRKLLFDLTTQTLYCGTSIRSIFEGMSNKEKEECFLNGYVCIRGFNTKTREPGPLHERFHQALNKAVKISRKGKSPRKRTKNNGTNL